MGILSFINKFRRDRQGKRYAAMLNNGTPIFSQFGTNIYASDVVQQAIACIVSEMKKLTLTHIRYENFDSMPIDNSEITKILHYPNSLMTMSDFLEKITWLLFLNYNAFIIPTYETVGYDEDGQPKKKWTGLYPIQPINVTFLQDPSGRMFIQFQFLNGYETTLRYSDVIHIKYRYSVNEVMGGNQFGQPDNDALLKTLQMNSTLLEGVSNSVKASYAINGVVKYNTLLDDGKMEENIKRLENLLSKNSSGLLPLDLKGEYIPMQHDIKLVDADTLKFIDEKILRHFGVPLAILTGDYDTEQYNSFYMKTIQPLVTNYTQAFTKILFTPRERSFGNQIKLYPQELVFMNNSQKLTLFDILVDSGSCYKNELRVAFGLNPLPELIGEIAISSNRQNALNNATGENEAGGGLTKKGVTVENNQNNQINEGNKAGATSTDASAGSGGEGNATK